MKVLSLSQRGNVRKVLLRYFKTILLPLLPQGMAAPLQSFSHGFRVSQRHLVPHEAGPEEEIFRRIPFPKDEKLLPGPVSHTVRVPGDIPKKGIFFGASLKGGGRFDLFLKRRGFLEGFRMSGFPLGKAPFPMEEELDLLLAQGTPAQSLEQFSRSPGFKPLGGAGPLFRLPPASLLQRERFFAVGNHIHKIEHSLPPKIHGSGIEFPGGDKIPPDLRRKLRRDRFVPKFPGSFEKLFPEFREPGTEFFGAVLPVEVGVESLKRILPESFSPENTLFHGKRKSYEFFLGGGKTIGPKPVGLRKALPLSPKEHRKALLHLPGKEGKNSLGRGVRFGGRKDIIPHPKATPIRRGTVENRNYRKRSSRIRILQGETQPELRLLQGLPGATDFRQKETSQNEAQKKQKREGPAAAYHGTTPTQAYPQEMAVLARMALSQSLQEKVFRFASFTRSYRPRRKASPMDSLFRTSRLYQSLPVQI